MTGDRASFEKLLAIALSGLVILSIIAIMGPGLTGLVGATNHSVEESADWPQNQYDDGRTGHTDSTTGPKGPVEELWSVELTGMSSGTVAPVLSNGTVFVGSNDGNVSAYDAANGSHIWTAQVVAGDEIRSLTMAEDHLYVGGMEYVFALDPARGATVWSSPFSLAADSVESQTQIVVHDDRVYVAGMDAASFDAGYLYALNATTGTQVWRFQTDSIIWESGVALANDTVYVGDGRDSFSGTDGGLYAVNASSGTLRWTKDYSARVRASPTVANGTVFVAKENGDLVAYDGETGNEQWNTTVSFGVDVVESPAVADGVVYIGTLNTGEVWAYDASTGATVWSGPLETDGTVASPVVVDGVLYVASTGDLYGAYPGNGTQRFAHTYGVGESTPAVVNGTVYVHDGSFPGNLYAITDVTEPANFGVAVNGTNSPVEEGQTLSVTVDLENSGDEQGQQNVTLTVDSIERDRQSVTLASGEIQTVTLEWATTSGDTGDYTATVASDNSTDTVAVSVETPSTPTATASPTPTPTPSPTPTPTPTPSPTPSPTPTPVPTASPTPTPSPTATQTPTPSPTPTATQSSGGTGGQGGPPSTATPTATATSTPTPTPTATATPTPTPNVDVTGGEAVAYGRSGTATPTPTPGAAVAAGEAIAYGVDSGSDSSPPGARVTEADQPGFGVVPALVAVVIAATLYRRR